MNKRALSWTFLMVTNSWMPMRNLHCNHFFFAVEDTSFLIPLFIFIMLVRILRFEASDSWENVTEAGPLQKLLCNEQCVWQTPPYAQAFYTRSQAKRAGRDLLWFHIKLESRVKRAWLQDPPWILRKTACRCSKLGLVSLTESLKPWILLIKNMRSQIYIWDHFSA